jgi:2-oxo-4-hydroxy-4-carboxy-5-ureidoimidazoline decarboxylase
VSTIEHLNALPPDEVAAVLAPSVPLPRIADELARSRPFADFDALLDAAVELTNGLSDDDVRQALAAHPRIGARAAGWSSEEQAGVDRADNRLPTANAEYEARFGHIYLVCATGRDADELLADLRARLSNDPTAELVVVRRELGKITRLRLARIVQQFNNPMIL